MANNYRTYTERNAARAKEYTGPKDRVINKGWPIDLNPGEEIEITMTSQEPVKAARSPLPSWLLSSCAAVAWFTLGYAVGAIVTALQQ